MKKNWPYSKFPFQSKVKLIFPVNIVRPSDQLAKLEAARASIFHLNLVAGKIKKVWKVQFLLQHQLKDFRHCLFQLQLHFRLI